MNSTVRRLVVALLVFIFFVPAGWAIGRAITPGSERGGRLGAAIAVVTVFVALNYWAYVRRDD